MRLLSFKRGSNKAADISGAERDVIMAKAIAEYDAEMKTIEKWENDPANIQFDCEKNDLSITDIAIGVAVGTAIGRYI